MALKHHSTRSLTQKLTRICSPRWVGFATFGTRVRVLCPANVGETERTFRVEQVPVTSVGTLHLIQGKSILNSTLIQSEPFGRLFPLTHQCFVKIVLRLQRTVEFASAEVAMAKKIGRRSTVSHLRLFQVLFQFQRRHLGRRRVAERVVRQQSS